MIVISTFLGSTQMSSLDINNFKPHHINAEREDFLGNDQNGRYMFIPGSNSRAEYIANKYFKNIIIKRSSRGHDLYLGDIEHNGKTYKFGSISTGMGTPSVDLILTELIILGAKRFLRIGTAGSMQNNIKCGDIVCATASVRDEATTSNYVPMCFPAVANIDIVNHAQQLAKNNDTVKFGIVHTKDSLYAREMLLGPSADNSKDFMQKAQKYGVVASEMESSHIFVLSQIYAQQFGYPIKSGCILGILSDAYTFDLSNKQIQENTITSTVEFGVKTLLALAQSEN